MSGGGGSHAELGMRAGEIAGTGADRKLADPFGFGVDADGPIAALGNGLGRMVAKNILMANILCNFRGNTVHLIE
jgi:hypothetical protein